MKAFFALALVAFVALAEARTLVRRDAKSDLLTKANALLTKADAAIAHLRTGSHTHEVAIVKHQEEQIKKLITDLTAATDDAKITSLEHELTRADTRLEHELTLISHRVPTLPHHPRDPTGPVSKRDVKDDLTTKGNALVTKLDEAIKKLTTPAHAHQLGNLKHEETQLKKLIADLTAATDDAKVKTLEHELQRLETRVQHQLDALNKTPVAPPTKRATKDELITKGNDLIKKAEAAATKLEADKKSHEATVLKHEEEHLKKLIADLTAATDDAKVRTLEHQLATAEARLEHELLRHSNPIHILPHEPIVHVPVVTKRATKEELITKGNDLVKKATEAVTKLTADHKAHEASVIKHEEEHVKKLIADLTAATDDAKIKTLEHQLTTAEGRLDTQLKKLSAPSTFA